MADSLTAPPLGAVGSAYSKCLKPGSYFISPYIESPCAGRATSSAPREGAATVPMQSRIARRVAEAFIDGMTTSILPIFVRGPGAMVHPSLSWLQYGPMATIQF